jgi:hypothetical protein
MRISQNHPVAIELRLAVRGGDLEKVGRLLAQQDQVGAVLIFAAAAALGAGLQVAVGTLDHSARVAPLFAAFTVAIPVMTFVVVLGLLNTRTSSEPAGTGLTLLVAALILAAAAATPILTLPPSIVIMVVLVALLLAYHLTAAHRATRQPNESRPPRRDTPAGPQCDHRARRADLLSGWRCRGHRSGRLGVAATGRWGVRLATLILVARRAGRCQSVCWSTVAASRGVSPPRAPGVRTR